MFANSISNVFLRNGEIYDPCCKPDSVPFEKGQRSLSPRDLSNPVNEALLLIKEFINLIGARPESGLGVVQTERTYAKELAYIDCLRNLTRIDLPYIRQPDMDIAECTWQEFKDRILNCTELMSVLMQLYDNPYANLDDYHAAIDEHIRVLKRMEKLLEKLQPEEKPAIPNRRKFQALLRTASPKTDAEEEFISTTLVGREDKEIKAVQTSPISISNGETQTHITMETSGTQTELQKPPPPRQSNGYREMAMQAPETCGKSVGAEKEAPVKEAPVDDGVQCDPCSDKHCFLKVLEPPKFEGL